MLGTQLVRIALLLGPHEVVVVAFVLLRDELLFSVSQRLDAVLIAVGAELGDARLTKGGDGGLVVRLVVVGEGRNDGEVDSLCLDDAAVSANRSARSARHGAVQSVGGRFDACRVGARGAAEGRAA